MSDKHTQGRLTVRGGYSIYADDGKTPVADTCLTNSVPGNDEANARRLVACWNACEGLSTAGVEIVANLGGIENKLRVTSELVRQRDELLAALKEVAEIFGEDWREGSTQRRLGDRARAVIAKAEASK